MKLTLQRGNFTKESTGGILAVNDTLQCFTLEDQVRSGPKVMGETAIPFGTYEVILSMSPKFKRIMPEILNVPGFTGIRIHTGNVDEDTEGCLLVGENLGIDNNDIKLLNSKIAYVKLFPILQKAFDAKEKIFITIMKAEAL
jgi:hypothetical protein